MTMNYYPQPPYRNFTQNNGSRVVSIASDSEMNNVAEDYSGIPLYFHNRTTNEIIIRQFDISTGLTITKKYIKTDGADLAHSEKKEEESINLYTEKLNSINDRIDSLSLSIENLIDAKGGKK